MEQVKSKVGAFLVRFSGGHTLNNDDDIFATGFVNSLFAMQLVLFLEQEFQITIETEDLDIDNFRTINVIASLVERKTIAAIAS
jgi:methoxymalonate biosynthesis acyl carrier protein